MSIMEKVFVFKGLSASRRLQWLGLQRDKLLTQLVFSRRLKACGANTIVQKPLFWTPEFIELGSRVFIWAGCRIEGIDSYGEIQFNPCIHIGDRSSFQQNCHVIAADRLFIGDDCTFSVGVLLTDNDHAYETDGQNVLAQPLIVRPTRIGHNCFIGAGAKIQAGTTLGDHCIVGANAVVRGSFPDHSVVAGVPARIIKRQDSSTGKWLRTNSEGEFLR